MLRYSMLLQQCQQSAHTLTPTLTLIIDSLHPQLSLCLPIISSLAPAILHILSPRAHPCFSAKLRNSHTSSHAQTLPDSSVVALWFWTAYASLPQASLRKWGTITTTMHHSPANLCRTITFEPSFYDISFTKTPDQTHLATASLITDHIQLCRACSCNWYYQTHYEFKKTETSKLLL